MIRPTRQLVVVYKQSIVVAVNWLVEREIDFLVRRHPSGWSIEYDPENHDDRNLQISVMKDLVKGVTDG